MLSACVAAGINVSLLGTDWCINPIVLRVEWWFDGKHFSSLNRMRSQTVPLTAAACSESDGQRDWFQTTAVLEIVWHSWAEDHNKLFCVQSPSVSECQFHMRSHDSVDAFLDCLPDWAQGLQHSQFVVDTHRTRSATTRLPINRLYPLFGFSLTECRYLHILSTCYEPLWQILGLKELMCK